MSSPSPRFTGIFIPSEILEHSDLTMLEQMLLSWIDALYCKEHKGCYAKNDYFAARLKVKENTIAKALTSLRQKGLVEDVSFDGRNRVIRSKIGEYVEKSQSKAGLDLNPKQGWIKIQGRVGFLSNPLLIDSKEDSKEEIRTPPTPPQNQREADASGMDAQLSPKTKSKKEIPDFSDLVKEVTSKMVKILQKYSPVYRTPGDMTKFLSCVRDMIEKDKQDPTVILKTFEWAVSDNEERNGFKGWQGIIATNNKGGKATNPAEIFRKYFSKIHSQMGAKPNRKFAPSSDLERAMEGMKKMNERAI